MVAYNKSKDEILEEVNSSQKGLSSFDAQNRLKKNGKNLLVGKKKISEFVKFLLQFKDVLILVLLASCVISIVLGIIERSSEELIDAGIILLVVLINALIGYTQERKSEQAMEALKNMTKPYCKVERDGVILKIKSEEVVVGDIVILEAGDIVPADLRLLECESLKVEESALTGESEAVLKDDERILENGTILGDRINMAFMGSVVTYGRGKGVVVATGMQTEMGKIATALDEIEDNTTPLTKRVKVTSLWLTGVVLAVTVMIFILNMVMGGEILQSFSLAIAIAVCAIPEGLPACMTVTLSLGVKRMSDQRAIVKKLPAVETLGSTQVICTDKTGTLTLNKMTVKKAFFFDSELDEFNKVNFGNKIFKTKNNEERNIFSLNKTIQEFLRSLVLCNDVKLKFEDDGKLACMGDPTEIALVHCGYNLGASKEVFESKFERVGEVPFDSNRKMMSTINLVDGKKMVYTKGALDNVLEKCTKVYDNGKIRKITDEDRDLIHKKNSNMALNALRVLAFACKAETENAEYDEKIENNLVFLGLAGMMDPPREEVKEAIKICNEAGIEVVMITGDHKDTAFAIAKELGICGSRKNIITGEELNKIPDEKFSKVVEKYKVYARVSPEHKVKIVKALKLNDKIVAMTGDGVNDAPSIKAADIGIGMGVTGTDVTKEAADIILTDDNFATIVGAVKEGRRIYQGILKILKFLLVSSFAELFAITFITFFFYGHSFFTPALILWINFVSDTFAGLALGFEKADKDIMKKPPQRTKGTILKGEVGASILTSSVFVAGVLIGIYSILTLVFHINDQTVTTICFLYICFTELFHAYNLKSDYASIFSKNPFDNKLLNYGFLVSAVLTSIIVVVPIAPLQNALGICTLVWWQWLLAIGLSIMIIPFYELVKVVFRYVDKKKVTKDEK